ncbi:hypothetical protein D9M68_791810 [compost metagenome]
MVGQQVVADRVHQMGLAQADAAVDEQRVVKLAEAARHVHRSSARHAVGRTFHQGGKGQRRVEAGLGRSRARDLCGGQIGQLGQHLVLHRSGCGRCPAGAFTRSECQLQRHRCALDGFQQQGDTGRVLGPDPVELEAVGYRHHDLGRIGRHAGRERPDPGVELLFGDFLREFVDAGQPEGLGVGGWGVWGGALDHAGKGERCIFVDK